MKAWLPEATDQRATAMRTEIQRPRRSIQWPQRGFENM
jgi:hypothetical protein